MVWIVELQTQVDDGLFKGDDALVELIDVDPRAEPGLAPGRFAEQLGEPTLELVDSSGEPGYGAAGRRRRSAAATVSMHDPGRRQRPRLHSSRYRASA